MNSNDETSKILSKYFNLTNHFERIKSVLKSDQKKESYFFDFVFNMFAYKISSPIRCPNFYHYASEAWLLTIFNQLQRDLSGETNEITFNDLLENIYNLKLDEDQFIENLEVLLGTFRTSDHVVKITQTKMSQIFLENIKKSQEITIRKRIAQTITRTSFEDILFLVLAKALNYTLNELDMKEEDKNSLLLLSTLTELKMKSPEDGIDYKKPNLVNFLKEVTRIKTKENKQNVNSRDVSILNSIETFYFFYSSSFADLLEDIHIFNVNSSNVICKIDYLVKNKLLQFKTYTKLAMDFIDTLPYNIRLRQIIDYMIQVYKTYSLKQTELVIKSKKSISDLKHWISESYIVATTQILIEQSLNLSKVYLYERIICPVKDITVFYSEHTLNVLINTGIRTKEQMMAIYSYILNKVKEYIGEEKIMKFSYDGNYVNIQINKIVFQKYSQMFNTLVKDSGLMKLLDCSNTAHVKSYLVRQFKNTLKSECEEEKCK